MKPSNWYMDEQVSVTLPYRHCRKFCEEVENLCEQYALPSFLESVHKNMLTILKKRSPVKEDRAYVVKRFTLLASHLEEPMDFIKRLDGEEYPILSELLVTLMSLSCMKKHLIEINKKNFG